MSENFSTDKILERFGGFKPTVAKNKRRKLSNEIENVESGEFFKYCSVLRQVLLKS